ncbi:hypothetical protein SAMN04515669_0004 [Jiangella sp. DSM 45060]|nr:hypothetical protein SAMN04515669_0004 [Jiangella sp. DSM 45060]
MISTLTPHSGRRTPPPSGTSPSNGDCQCPPVGWEALPAGRGPHSARTTATTSAHPGARRVSGRTPPSRRRTGRGRRRSPGGAARCTRAARSRPEPVLPARPPSAAGGTGSPARPAATRAAPSARRARASVTPRSVSPASSPATTSGAAPDAVRAAAVRASTAGSPAVAGQASSSRATASGRPAPARTAAEQPFDPATTVHGPVGSARARCSASSAQDAACTGRSGARTSNPRSSSASTTPGRRQNASASMPASQSPPWTSSSVVIRRILPQTDSWARPPLTKGPDPRGHSHSPVTATGGAAVPGLTASARPPRRRRR